ncbi:MAG: helix-turn-helix transcriptional regulator [Treponema sp.]|nr:helix-turn-helix transcriptional regulator [Treponema sp.]
MKNRKLLKEILSTNIKLRREALDISQEKLAELADVSIQSIKGIEGCRTWVSDTMLEKLASVLGVSAFQLLVPTNKADLNDDGALTAILLRNLEQNIHDDINARFKRLQTRTKKVTKRT